MRSLALYIVCFFWFGFVHSQTNYRFKNLTISDGLSQSSVLTIVQDDLNSLWIGTQDGLNRYDGKTFEIFTSDKTKGLNSEHILSSLKDENGDLWFGTSNGLTHYSLSKESFSTYKPKEGAALYVQDIVQDDNGNIWLATAENAVLKFSIKEKKFKTYNQYSGSKKTNNIALINQRHLVVSTEEGKVFVTDLSSNQTKEVNLLKKYGSGIRVNNIIENDGSEVVIATNRGGHLLNVETLENEAHFKNLNSAVGYQSISDIHYEPEIGWFLCTNNNGLFILNDKKGIEHCTEDIFQKTALLFNELNVIYKDASGTFWVGSKRGLSCFNPLKNGFLGVGPSGITQRGIPTPSVWSFDESNDGESLFIGTDRAISKYNLSTRSFRQFYREAQTKVGTGETSVLAIEFINKQKLLVGCADGLFELKINGDSYKFNRIHTSGNHDRIYDFVHWKNSLYWIATKGGALLYNEETSVIKEFNHNQIAPENSISKGICREVYKDKNGRIWFTTSTGGLNILSEKNGEPIIRPYEHNYIIKNVSTDYITSIYQEKQGVYWLGTSGSGLLRWDERSKQVEQTSKIDGLPNDVIYGILPGVKGELWLSTNKGLSRVSLKTKKIKNYTEVDGLMSNEFNLGAYLISQTGKVYFGGIYGYNYFDPNELIEASEDIDIVFTRFKLENEWLTPESNNTPLYKPIYETKEINLGYKQRNFTIRFQPSDLSNSEKINYKYLLEGSEEGEVLIGTQNEIHFSSLAYGTYVLKVYARYADGPWGDPASIVIDIDYPFWYTWWFWLIVVFVVALLIRAFIRVRVEASRREQVRLEMKIRDRTREIKEQNKKIEKQKEKIEEERNKVVEQQRLLQIEKDKSERLLKNIIPESTAEELKKKGKARARSYKRVSVLFTDFVGFTKISEGMSATDLVKKLDVFFTKFDEIIVKNNLEKIKTIGDAYMCAGGVPVRNNTNPIDACLAALQIQEYMKTLKEKAISKGEDYWQLRLGINTGEVTAGVIGSERLQYDVWGATVNQAQRMEMLGEPEKVTITGATFKHIEPYFECSFLGKAQSKSRGLIDMYIVHRIKPGLSLKGKGIEPNKRFNQIVNLHLYSSINYYRAERHIMKVLSQGLSKNLHYHSIAHTQDVVKAVERLALLENVTDEGLFLLKSAATYHDAGFVERYDENEEIGVRLAHEILPMYGYTDQHIETIKELIYATRIPHEPNNHLEEIICDADLDYLGREDFHKISKKLCQELIEHGKIENEKQWDEIQIKFLTQHKYFTKTAIRTRSNKKEENLNEVRERLKRNEYN